MPGPTIHSGFRCVTCGGAVLATNDAGLSCQVLDMWSVTHDGHEVEEVGEGE